MIISTPARTELFCNHCGKTLVIGDVRKQVVFKGYQRAKNRGWIHNERNHDLKCPTCQIKEDTPYENLPGGPD